MYYRGQPMRRMFINWKDPHKPASEYTIPDTYRLPPGGLPDTITTFTLASYAADGTPTPYGTAEIYLDKDEIHSVFVMDIAPDRTITLQP